MDIPLPGGLEYVQDQSAVIESETVRAARLVYTSKFEPGSLVLSIQEGLLGNGWRIIRTSSFGNQGTMQLYEKGDASLQVRIWEGGAFNARDLRRAERRPVAPAEPDHGGVHPVAGFRSEPGAGPSESGRRGSHHAGAALDWLWLRSGSSVTSEAPPRLPGVQQAAEGNKRRRGHRGPVALSGRLQLRLLPRRGTRRQPGDGGVPDSGADQSEDLAHQLLCQGAAAPPSGRWPTRIGRPARASVTVEARTRAPPRDRR